MKYSLGPGRILWINNPSNEVWIKLKLTELHCENVNLIEFNWEENHILF
jgi:hypothetical protein